VKLSPAWELLAISPVEICTGGCEDRTWAREAEESPLSEAVAMEQLMKTQQSRERLTSYCGYL
jgi:hypothetical protein